MIKPASKIKLIIKLKTISELELRIVNVFKFLKEQMMWDLVLHF